MLLSAASNNSKEAKDLCRNAYKNYFIIAFVKKKKRDNPKHTITLQPRHSINVIKLLPDGIISFNFRSKTLKSICLSFHKPTRAPRDKTRP